MSEEEAAGLLPRTLTSRRTNIVTRIFQNSPVGGAASSAAGCRPVMVVFCVALAFLVGAMFGQSVPTTAARNTAPQSMSAAEASAQRAVETGASTEAAAVEGGSSAAPLVVAAELDLAPGAKSAAVGLPGLWIGFSHAPAKATPLLAIYGDMSYWERYVRVEFFQLFSLLTNVYGWRVVMPPPAQVAAAAKRKASHPIVGSGVSPGVTSWADFEKMLVSSLGALPDVLLLAEDFMLLGMHDWLPKLGPRAPGSAMSSVALWLFADDVHWHNGDHRTRKVASYTAVDRVVSCYSYLLPSLYPELRSLMPARLPAHPAGKLAPKAGAEAQASRCPQALPGWLPHAASTLYQLPLHPDPVPKVLLTGKTTPLWYQYRQIVEKKVNAKDPRFVQLAHPGQYDLKYNSRKQKGVGASFATSLNKHLACFTDGLFLNYAVAKVFEIPATGCLLLINEEMVPVLDRLGFAPHVHYVPYNRTSLDAVVDAVLNPANRAAVDGMRRAGQELVWARHMTTHRAASLHQMAVEASAPAARLDADGSTSLCRNHGAVYDGAAGFYNGFGGVLGRLNKAVHTNVKR